MEDVERRQDRRRTRDAECARACNGCLAGCCLSYQGALLVGRAFFIACKFIASKKESDGSWSSAARTKQQVQHDREHNRENDAE